VPPVLFLLAISCLNLTNSAVASASNCNSSTGQQAHGAVIDCMFHQCWRLRCSAPPTQCVNTTACMLSWLALRSGKQDPPQKNHACQHTLVLPGSRLSACTAVGSLISGLSRGLLPYALGVPWGVPLFPRLPVIRIPWRTCRRGGQGGAHTGYTAGQGSTGGHAWPQLGVQVLAGFSD
jgi:hypothetical protein